MSERYRSRQSKATDRRRIRGHSTCGGWCATAIPAQEIEASHSVVHSVQGRRWETALMLVVGSGTLKVAKWVVGSAAK